MSEDQSRRRAIKQLMMGSVAVSALSSFTPFENNATPSAALKGNINHAVCRWCYNSIPLPDLCQAAKDMGIKGIDLVGPKDWPTLKEYGLYSSMCNGKTIQHFFSYLHFQHAPALLNKHPLNSKPLAE